MLIIPVIDIRSGVVVRAAGGDRSNYRPIQTPLAQSSEPLDVARGLLGLHEGLRRLYIADLDGIEGRERNLSTVLCLSEALQNVQLLVDDGSATAEAVAAFEGYPQIRPVIGSETLKDAAALAAIARAMPQGIMLSLDWRGEEALGPRDLFADPSSWPDDIIVMSLARVGSGRGPDIDRVKEIRTRAGRKRIYAAGGVRNTGDLMALVGFADGVLVASALHDGVIRPVDIERLISTSMDGGHNQ